MAKDNLTFAGEFPPATREQWLKLVEGVLRGAPFDKKLVSRTYDQLRIEPLYARDANARPVIGRAPAMPWQILQRVDHPDPAKANAEALHDLENGATGLTLVFAGSAESHGYGLDSSADAIERVLEGIQLDAISLDLDLAWNATDAPAHIVGLAKRRKLDPASLDFRMSFDPIGSVASAGASLVGWETLAPRFAAMVAEFAAQNFRGPFATADGRIIHAAGGSEAQELAWTLAVAVAYLRAFEQAGIALDAARHMVSFKLAADADQFLTIAKFRALRTLWARVEAACGLDPRPGFVAAETAWRMMTKRDPWVNLLRTTVATFSAALGGANSISVLPFTIALGLPDRFARRLARNTQLILLEESNLAKVADPAAGSGSLEDLTHQLCDAAWRLFQDIERNGGAWRALEAAFIQNQIAAVRTERQQAAACGRDALTGTNAFPDIHERPVAVLDIAPRKALAPKVAEVSVEPLPRIRLAELFEDLRDRSDRVLAATGARPEVFLANLGTPSDFTSRSTFAKNFFEAGGIEAVTNEGFLNSADIASAFKASGTKLACICSSDAIYARDAQSAARALSEGGAMRVYLAGRPGDQEAALTAAGVQAFIYVGSDMLATLAAAHATLGTR
jgi:methylmalonyl-CoA mutase